MRKIDYIIVHCTDSPQNWSKEDLLRCFRLRGWQHPGYHWAVLQGGQIVQLLNPAFIANGARGYNATSIHVAYVGGQNGKDNRTTEQRKALVNILFRLRSEYPSAKIIGHRDVNSSKSCPNFDAAKEYENI